MMIMSVNRMALLRAGALTLLASAMPADAAIYRGIRTYGGCCTTGALEVTTDGTLGVLGAANILKFKLTFSGLDERDIANYGWHPSIESSEYEPVVLNGTSLSATGSKLLFDFDSGEGFFGVQSPSYLFTSANCNCFQSSVEYYRLDPEFSNWISRSGVEVLGIVPEPASWALLITGFGFTGTAMRRHRVLGRLKAGVA
ncbi:PEPxxWA-CTERM sorting domain-containing protein [Sandarakinorhabdus sp.]|uniref:PEPxxWA-CTERM sorting domain-containing protein n=1 Tax=Sandarakinorhabdus sp. TaxID=1916663 RepID=UPI00286E1272|nr:PEPxxWA-CTERM sorting domain-containing protein [Sandarakinorhabdus sp.]